MCTATPRLRWNLDAATVAPPSLYCPLPAGIHADADAISAATVAWALTQGLVDARSAPRLGASAIGGLVGRAHPRAARALVQLAADWTTLFCLLDDALERMASPAAVATALSQVAAALAGEPVAGADVFVRAAADLGVRIAAVATAEQRAHFIDRVVELFDAFVNEAAARTSGEPLAPAAYLPLREVTVGIHVELALGEIIEDIALTVGDRAALARAGLPGRACDLVGWANDLYTYEKELQDGDTLNLVVVLGEAEGLDLPQAVARAAALHDAEAGAFVARAAALVAAGTGTPLGRYVALLGAWVRGHLDWAAATGRYRPAR